MTLNYRHFIDDATSSYASQMPLIIGSGARPIGVAEAIEGYLDEETASFFGPHVYTGDGVIVPAQGEFTDNIFKICLNSPRLRGVNLQTELVEGSLRIEDYNAIPGIEFRERDCLLGREMTRGEAKRHPVLLEFSGRDQNKLEEIVDRVFCLGRRKGLRKMMGIFPSLNLGEHADEMAWFVYRLEFSSQVYGSDFDKEDCRLVGIVPEAQEVEKTALA